MISLALAALFVLQEAPAPKAEKPQEPPPQAAAAAPKPEPKAEPKPEPPAHEVPRPVLPQSLSFYSETFAFHWEELIPLSINVDGLKVTSIQFGKREPRAKFLQGPDYGSRAIVEVTNSAAKPRTPGFAVAVFDKDGRLLGAANGGTKIGTVKPGGTETFDLSFFQVKERLPKGDHYVLSVELRD